MSEWTLMNQPAFRSKDNAKSGNLVQNTISNIDTNDEATTAFLNSANAPLFLLISRNSATTITLNSALDDSVIYKIRDTGRGSLSSKPDFEVFRQSNGNELFVGSIRFGTRKTEIKLPLTGRKTEDIETFDLVGKKKYAWEVVHMGREKNVNRSLMTDEERKRSSPSWVIILDCNEKGAGEVDPMCTVKLFDVLPNGRMEIWEPEAKAAVFGKGGDWNLLDELVTIGYANTEKARRKLNKTGSDPTGVGIAGIGAGV